MFVRALRLLGMQQSRIEKLPIRFGIGERQIQLPGA